MDTEYAIYYKNRVPVLFAKTKGEANKLLSDIYEQDKRDGCPSKPGTYSIKPYQWHSAI